MEERVYKVNVYNYNELNNKAKEKAKDWYIEFKSDMGYEYEEECDAVIDNCFYDFYHGNQDSELHAEYDIDYYRGRVNLYGTLYLNECLHIDGIRNGLTDDEADRLEKLFTERDYSKVFEMDGCRREIWCQCDRYDYTENIKDEILEDMEVSGIENPEIPEKTSALLDKFSGMCAVYWTGLCNTLGARGVNFFYEVDDEIMAEWTEDLDVMFYEDGRVAV